MYKFKPLRGIIGLSNSNFLPNKRKNYGTKIIQLYVIQSPELDKDRTSIIRYEKRVGEIVKKDDIVAEISTGWKATPVRASVAGVIDRLFVIDGSEIICNQDLFCIRPLKNFSDIKPNEEVTKSNVKAAINRTSQTKADAASTPSEGHNVLFNSAISADARRSGKGRAVDLPDKNNYESQSRAGSHPVAYVAQQLRDPPRNKHHRVNDPISDFRKIEGNKKPISNKEQSKSSNALQVTTKSVSLMKHMSGVALAIQQPPEDKLIKITSLSYSSSNLTTNKPPKSDGRNKNNSLAIAKEPILEKRFTEFPKPEKQDDKKQLLCDEQIITLAKQVSAPFVKRKKVLHVCTKSVVPDDDIKETPIPKKPNYYSKQNKKMMLFDDYEQVPENKNSPLQQFAEMSLPKVPKAPKPSVEITKEEKLSKVPSIVKSAKIIKKSAIPKFIEPLHEINFFENTNPFTAVSKVSCSQAARKSLTKLNEDMDNSPVNDTKVVTRVLKVAKSQEHVKIKKKISTTKMSKSKKIFADKKQKQRKSNTKVSKSRAFKVKHENQPKDKKKKAMGLKTLAKSSEKITQPKLSAIKNNPEAKWSGKKVIKKNEPKIEEPNNFLSKDDGDHDGCLYYREKSPPGNDEVKAKFKKLSSLKPEDKANVKLNTVDRFSQLSPSVLDPPKRRDKPDINHEYPNFDDDDDIQPISQIDVDKVSENNVRKTRSAPSREQRVTPEDQDTKWRSETKAHTKRNMVKRMRSKTRRRKND